MDREVGGLDLQGLVQINNLTGSDFTTFHDLLPRVFPEPMNEEDDDKEQDGDENKEKEDAKDSDDEEVQEPYDVFHEHGFSPAHADPPGRR